MTRDNLVLADEVRLTNLYESARGLSRRVRKIEASDKKDLLLGIRRARSKLRRYAHGAHYLANRVKEDLLHRATYELGIVELKLAIG